MPNRVIPGATILIVDDEEPNRIGLAELLSLEHFRVATASNGQVALEVFARTRPDLVLLDVRMPGMSGFEVCRQLKQDPETCLTPVVLVTALSAIEDRIQGIEAGADDFITKPIDRVQLLARIRSLLKQKAYTDELERAESVLFALARSIEAKDPYTGNHCERLSEYALRLATRLELSPEAIDGLRKAAIVHDIGKVAVPDSILLKPGPLNEEELRIMRRHPAVGERICAPLKSFRLALPIILHHHERWDGSGYPDGMHGEEIPVTARVLQMVDVFDALTTQRPYKPAFAIPEALQIMSVEVKAQWLDPGMFEQFQKLVLAAEEPFALVAA